MINLLLTLAISVSVLYFAFRRGLIFLQIAQQDEYSPISLLAWYKEKLAFDRQASILSLLIVIAAYFINCHFLLALLGAFVLYGLTFFMLDPRKEAKLPLNFTARAKKIFQVYFLLLLVLWMICLFIHGSCKPVFLFAAVILTVQAVPFLMILSLKILEPFEKKVQSKFINEAKEKVVDLSPLTVGITGSFGKTSVKNALGEVLQVTLGSTFWPAAGTNTLMGITRSIRETLSSAHKFAVIEMAAYRQGSIAKLCELTPPDIAIITAIGNQHLERFGSLDVTYQAKTELAAAVPESGTLVCNADNALAKRAGIEFKKKSNIFYGFSNDELINVQGKNLVNTLDGASFEIFYQGKNYKIQTKLVGMAAISNLLGVFAVAVAMGAKPELVAVALSNLNPVKNRLQLEKTKTGYWLHDAYNSNESGMLSAIDVLDELKVEQKILVTPGVIELGEEQFKINQQIAERAAKVADFIIVVGEVNRAAYEKGVADKHKLFTVANRDEAFQRLFEIKKDNSIVLLANDLSDFYEAKYRF